MLYKRVLALICVGAVAALLSGCGKPVMVNGGGWIASVDPDAHNGKANFGFWGDSCDGSVQGNFNYLDKGVGVKMNGWVTEAEECFWGGPPSSSSKLCALCQIKAELLHFRKGDAEGPLMAVAANYRSTNPKKRGEGELIACATDNGEGQAAPDDLMLVYVESGPFENYLNWGEVQGNIQYASCPEPE